jgi:hypothetical protein
MGNDKLTVEFNDGRPARVFENCRYENDSKHLHVYHAGGKFVANMSDVARLDPIKGAGSTSKDWPRESMNESER